eukprot:gene30812-35843_t
MSALARSLTRSRTPLQTIACQRSPKPRTPLNAETHSENSSFASPDLSLSSTTTTMATTTQIQRLDVGPRLSEATIHAGVVYLAGQVPEDGSADMKGQSVFIVDFAEFAVFNEVWAEWVVPGATPARATVQVPMLAVPEWKLEIVVTCAL